MMHGQAYTDRDVAEVQQQDCVAKPGSFANEALVIEADAA